MALALLLGLLANLTVIGSVAPSGIVPFNFWMARSASILWSNRIKPTPLESPSPVKRNRIYKHCSYWQIGGTPNHVLINYNYSFNYQLIKSPRSPVILSHRMREVIMLPEQENNRSKSGWAICLGNPDTYKLAPFIASLLGRA